MVASHSLSSATPSPMRSLTSDKGLKTQVMAPRFYNMTEDRTRSALHNNGSTGRVAVNCVSVERERMIIVVIQSLWPLVPQQARALPTLIEGSQTPDSEVRSFGWQIAAC